MKARIGGAKGDWKGKKWVKVAIETSKGDKTFFTHAHKHTHTYTHTQTHRPYMPTYTSFHTCIHTHT